MRLSTSKSSDSSGCKWHRLYWSRPMRENKTAKNNIKPCKEQKGCQEEEPICFHKFKYFQGPPSISQKALFENHPPLCQRPCSSHSAVTERSEGEWSTVAWGYITLTVRSPFSKTASTCTVFAWRRCLCMQSMPFKRLVNTRDLDQGPVGMMFWQ